LVVDADAVLSFAIVLQRFEPVAGQGRKVLKRRRRVEARS
jgi:hypothetical protein